MSTKPTAIDMSNSQPDKVRYAVVGLGYISQSAMLPAFAHAKQNSQLVSLVSSDPQKLSVLGNKHGVPADQCYTYDRYDEMLKSGLVDAVYIALPNSMHCEYSLRALRAGVHVLCEKPMARTADECQQMLLAAEDNNVRLMVAYRLHFEPANLKAMEIVQSGRIGEPKFFQSVFSMQVKEGDIRLQRALGGGTLYDIGIYCINAARYLFRDEPIEVWASTAKSDDARFREVDECTSAIMQFPGDKLAAFTCSFGSADTAHYRIVGTKGNLALDKAYELAEPMHQSLTIKGRTTKTTYPRRDQFAPELLHFSTCILEHKPPGPSGEEGLADVRIIQALYESARTGRPMSLTPLAPPTRPSPQQIMSRPPVRKPQLVNARRPTVGV